jgi:hypothetical protein
MADENDEELEVVDFEKLAIEYDYVSEWKLEDVDDPKGITTTMPEEVMDCDATAYFVDRVQAIRWELHALLVDLDVTDGCTEEAETLVRHAIEDLGIAARSEVKWLGQFSATE